MPASKIQDESEVRRWFAEGRTYAYMVETYREKYDIETVPSMWGNFRRRKGLPRRIVRDDDLIPWAVAEQHRWSYPVVMLRIEARIRAGAKVDDEDRHGVSVWKRNLAESGHVVHYDTEAGWSYVPRRDGIDRDLIREPERKTGRRRA